MPPRGRNLSRVVSKDPQWLGNTFFHGHGLCGRVLHVAVGGGQLPDKIGPAAITPYLFYQLGKGGLPKVTQLT